MWDAAQTALSCELPFAETEEVDREHEGDLRQIISYPNGNEGSHLQLDKMFENSVDSEFCPQTLFWQSKLNNYIASAQHRCYHLASILIPFTGLFGMKGSSPDIGGYRTRKRLADTDRHCLLARHVSTLNHAPDAHQFQCATAGAPRHHKTHLLSTPCWARDGRP